MHIGIDTSCYTTSVALAENGAVLFDRRIMLEVPPGSRGLRQSDGVFLHTRNLAEIFRALSLSHIEGVAVSARPRSVAGSYMPVFLSGQSAGRIISAAAGCPYREFSHQEGHLMAGLSGAGALHWRRGRFLALHLSGGTTEVLLSDGGEVSLVGKTLDISAGQLIDRVGVSLGLPFPCGAAMQALAERASDFPRLPVSVRGLDVNFSGAEARALAAKDASPEALAAAVLDCVARSVEQLAENAMAAFGLRRVLAVGGVAGSTRLRERLGERVRFASPGLSSDNAVGIALLGEEKHKEAV